MKNLENLKISKVLNHFEEISKIPRGSGNEKEISNYLVNFAKKLGLEVIQDEALNVIIKKPASKGYENAPTVIIQGHLDMVCEKNKDTIHDFLKDPIELIVKEDSIYANGTTLGADDGTGVAYMLALLADPNAKHPALECVFTVQEEVGLFGALALKKEYFKAKRMINLDDGGETISCMSSAGGVRVNINKAYEKTTVSDPVYRLEVKGLHGGHSGGAINEERGNANRILARLLYVIDDVQIVDFEGGDKDNAIPREATAIFATALTYDEVNEKITALFNNIYKEYEGSDAGLYMVLEQAQANEALSKASSKDLLKFLLIVPNGLYHSSMQIEGLPTASANLASVHIQDQIIIHCSLRGASASFIEDLENMVSILCESFNYEVEFTAGYPAWSYDAVSNLRETMKEVCLKMYGKELELIAVHGGLECGVFKTMIPDLEIATMGPIMFDIHTPQERLDLASFDRTFDFLKAILEQL